MSTTDNVAYEVVIESRVMFAAPIEIPMESKRQAQREAASIVEQWQHHMSEYNGHGVVAYQDENGQGGILAGMIAQVYINEVELEPAHNYKDSKHVDDAKVYMTGMPFTNSLTLEERVNRHKKNNEEGGE